MNIKKEILFSLIKQYGPGSTIQLEVLAGLIQKYGPDNALHLHDSGKFRVRVGGLWGIYSPQSKKLILPTKYDAFESAGGNAFATWQGKLVGVYNTDSEEFELPVEYEYFRLYRLNGIYAVCKNKLWGIYAYPEKRLIVPIVYTDIKFLDDKQVKMTKITTETTVVTVPDLSPVSSKVVVEATFTAERRGRRR